jgi:hypothetical protein
MNRYVMAFCLGLMIVWNTGCGTPTRAPAPPLASVKGSIKLDGEPMADGEIAFSVPGETPKVFPISKGSFSGQANEGKNLVEVFLYKEGPPLSTDPKGPPTKINTLPPKYSGSESTLKAEVAAGNANDFKFEVTSK